MAVGLVEGKIIPEAVVAVVKLMVDTAEKTNLNIHAKYATQESAEFEVRSARCRRAS